MNDWEVRASTYAAKKVREQFVGRRGHGGAPVTRRVLRPGELRKLLADAYLDGANERHSQR